MNAIRNRLAAVLLSSLALASHAEEGQLNIICSVQADWCNLIQTTFSRTTGIKVNLITKSTGEALAQISAERANPKTDVWFGGSGDPHLQAAEQDLTQVYKSPALSQLHPWALRQAEQGQFKTVGIYLGPLGFAYNPEVLAKKKLPVPRSWADLIKPIYKGELQMANPASSGAAYTAVATMVQLMGEDKASAYMAQLHKNMSSYPRSGEGPMKAVSRGEAGAAIVFIALGPGEKAAGFPTETLTPVEGTGAEIGSMSIVKGARNLDNARRFYEWALTPQAQQFATAARGFQVPSHKNAPSDPRIPDISKIKLINYDYAKYGSTAVRRGLISKWEQTIAVLPQ